MHPSAKIAISLPPELLAQIDDLAHQLDLSRSALIRRAIQDLLNRYAAQETALQAMVIYAQIDKVEQRIAEDLQTVSRETIPGHPGEGKSP